jgi:hypothetical protein
MTDFPDPDSKEVFGVSSLADTKVDFPKRKTTRRFSYICSFVILQLGELSNLVLPAWSLRLRFLKILRYVMFSCLDFLYRSAARQVYLSSLTFSSTTGRTPNLSKANLHSGYAQLLSHLHNIPSTED